MGARRSPATIDSMFKTGRNKHYDKVDQSKAFLSTQKNSFGLPNPEGIYAVVMAMNYLTLSGLAVTPSPLLGQLLFTRPHQLQPTMSILG